jgi:hypothetical protein
MVSRVSTPAAEEAGSGQVGGGAEDAGAPQGEQPPGTTARTASQGVLGWLALRRRLALPCPHVHVPCDHPCSGVAFLRSRATKPRSRPPCCARLAGAPPAFASPDGAGDGAGSSFDRA